MIQTISAEKIFFDSTKYILVDVRTSSEYEDGTIPGAINLPIFNEAERSELGVIYKIAGPAHARFKGLSLVSPKLEKLATSLKPYIDRKIVLFCWRGGLRSQALVTVLKLVGFDVYYLEGGYKAYRRFVIEYLENYSYQQKFIILEGLTGVGKTEVIKALKIMGEPAIDIESLAGHRGSVFGHIGVKASSQKNFESLLALELEKYRNFDYLIVECESRKIGNVFLPANFYEVMKRGIRILLYDKFEHRIRKLLNTYLDSLNGDVSLINNALDHLESRLGGKKVSLIRDYFKEKKFADAISLLLREYYDPLYNFPDGPSENYCFSVFSNDPISAASEIRSQLNYILKN